MKNAGRENAQETGIQNLVDQYLASRTSLKSSVGETSLHLDEDSLAAFAEGTLSLRESTPVISHLVDCGFCRHKTAELVVLDLELSAADDRSIPAVTTEPSTISQALSNVLSKIFGTSDQAVFAHHEKEDDKEKEEEKHSKED